MSSKQNQPQLYRCEPVDWLWLPKPVRIALGWVVATIFSLTFLSIPICAIFLVPSFWRTFPKLATFLLASVFLSVLLPPKEWKIMRRVPQLLYELYDFSCNLSPETCRKLVMEGDFKQYIIGMHPHGIVPIQALLWTAYCDQYMHIDDRALYGFGAAADVVNYIPFLRNIMGWLAGGSAEYKVLKDGLTKGICPCVNAAGRTPKHLYILPGGVAEVFTSTPGKHVIVFKNRRGLIKLSLETGAQLAPTYVFGGTDFFNNLATGDGLLSRLSRNMRAGVTIFWGYFGLPIPFRPKVTLCIADPIPVEKWTGEGPIPEEKMEELHKKYMDSIQSLFDKYKAVAGYPDAVLEIR